MPAAWLAFLLVGLVSSARIRRPHLGEATSTALDAAALAPEAELQQEGEASSEDHDLQENRTAADLGESLAEIEVPLEAWQEAWLARVLREEEEETDEVQAESLAEFAEAEDEDEEEDYQDGEEAKGAKARSLAQTSGARRRRTWTPWGKVATFSKILGKGAHGSVQKLVFGDCGNNWSAAVKTSKIDPQIQDEYKVQEMMMQSGLSTGVMQTVTSKKKQYAMIEIGAGGSLQGFMKLWPEGLADTDNGLLAQEIFAQLTLVILQMHELGIVHEDLKPGNILINNEACADPKRVYSAETWRNEDCALKLADFSFACPIEKGCSHKPRGTPAYMAPETWKAGPADVSRDIWAVGVIFYKLLFAMFPYDTEGGLQVLMKKIQTGSKYRMRMAPWNFRPPFSTFTVRNRLWSKAHKVMKACLASPPKRLSAKEIWHLPYCSEVQQHALNADSKAETTKARIMPDCVREEPKRYRGLTVHTVPVPEQARDWEHTLL